MKKLYCDIKDCGKELGVGKRVFSTKRVMSGLAQWEKRFDVDVAPQATPSDICDTCRLSIIKEVASMYTEMPGCLKT